MSTIWISVKSSWRLDETYIKVSGKDRFLYSAGLKTCNKRSFSRKKIEIGRVKYLNNSVGQYHRGIKRRMSISTGFKEFGSAQRTMAGIEIINLIGKDQILKTESSTFKTFCELAC